jgi:hypothetical protein
MPITIESRAPTAREDAVRDFEALVGSVWKAFEELGTQRGIESVEVLAVLADNFETEVRRLERPLEGAPPFSAERLGGTVKGKNLPLEDDQSRVAVVFDAETWVAHPSPEGKLAEVHLICHELAHILIERGRHLAGVYDGVHFPSITSGEIARSQSLIVAGEYRADLLAEEVVRSMASVTVDGEERPIGTWELLEQNYSEALVQMLEGAYPAWPDLVDDYREWRITLEQLWGDVVDRVHQTLTFLIHAEALAEAAGVSAPSESGRLVSLPVMRLYISKPWRDFVAVVRTLPLLPSVPETLDFERRVREAGESTIREIWRRLGIEGSDDAALRQTHLSVEAPRRLLHDA